MILVRDFPLRQLHWQIQKDPWTQAVMRAPGNRLNDLAERVLALWNQNDFSKINEAQCGYWERLLGISGLGMTLEERRQAIQVAWLSGQKPTLELVRSLCEAWEAGATTVEYIPGELTIAFQEPGRPERFQVLEKAIDRVLPAHIVLLYDWYLRIRDVHEAMTISKLQTYHIYDFSFAEEE